MDVDAEPWPGCLDETLSDGREMFDSGFGEDEWRLVDFDDKSTDGIEAFAFLVVDLLVVDIFVEFFDTFVGLELRRLPEATGDFEPSVDLDVDWAKAMPN